jgi:hypothetical protein
VIVILLSVAVLVWAARGPGAVVGKLVWLALWAAYVVLALVRPLRRAAARRGQ